MCFLTLEDLTGQMEIVVFPKIYTQIKGFIKAQIVVKVEGRLSQTDQAIKVIANQVSELSPDRPAWALVACVDEQHALEDLRSFISKLGLRQQQDLPVYTFDPKTLALTSLPKSYWLDSHQPDLHRLIETWGRDYVHFLPMTRLNGWTVDPPAQLDIRENVAHVQHREADEGEEPGDPIWSPETVVAHFSRLEH